MAWLHPSTDWSLRITRRDSNITDFLFYINDISGGSWAVSGQPSDKITVSKTPADPGTYEFKGLLSTCKNGFDADTSSGCQNDELFTVVRSRLVDITPAPSHVIHTYGRLIGPAHSGTGGFASTRFGVVRGTNKVTVRWTQPAPNPTVNVKGYVLTIARPGDQDSRHRERIITNTMDPEGDPNDSRSPCGPMGADTDCALEMTFPMQGITKTLTGEGRYDIVLATIWQDGYRTDTRDGRALCDDGTPQGTFCGPLVPAPRVTFPGISDWSIYITKTAWPDSLVGGPTTAYYHHEAPPAVQNKVTMPRYILLLDYNLKRAAFIELVGCPTTGSCAASPSGSDVRIWGPVTSNFISRQPEMISFDSGRLLGNGENFRFDDDLLPEVTKGGTFRTYDVHDCPACQDEPDIRVANVNTPGSAGRGREVSFMSAVPISPVT